MRLRGSVYQANRYNVLDQVGVVMGANHSDDKTGREEDSTGYIKARQPPTPVMSGIVSRWSIHLLWPFVFMVNAYMH